MNKTGPVFPSVLGVAENYFPIKEGLEWKYITKDKREPVQVVRILKQLRIEGKDLIVVEEDTNFIRFYLKREDGLANLGSSPPIPVLEQVVPFVWYPSQIHKGYKFDQIPTQKVDTGRDYDGDGKNETVEMTSTVTIGGEERMSVPAGTYDAVRIDYHLAMVLHFSNSKKTENLYQHVTQWAAKGVGVIKRVDKGHGVRFDKDLPLPVRESSDELAGISYTGAAPRNGS
jgi:hypothetical protein